MPMVLISTLGNFSVQRSGRSIPLRSAKDKALLAYLAINSGRFFTRVQLADLLWGDNSEKPARHSLNQALYSIRRLLPDIITVNRQGVVCDPALVSTDLDEVTKDIHANDIAAAIQRIRGTFLCDLDIRDSDQFEEWRSNTNRTVFRTYDQLISRKVTDCEATNLRPGQLPLSAVDELPLTIAAVNTKEELNVAENHKTFTFESPDLHAAFVPPFVGRTQHLDKLHALWTSALAGEASFALIRGRPGHGKTRLATEFITQVEKGGARVLQARCYEAERRIGFYTIADLLSDAVSPADLRGIDLIWRSAIAQIVPDLTDAASPPPPLNGLAGQTRVFEAILRLFQHIATERPTIIFIDDVQWTDRSTKALLSYLTHRLSGARILLVATYRITKSGPTLPPPFDEWVSVEPAELTLEEIAYFVHAAQGRIRARFPPEHEIHQLTGGHPYLLAEVARAAASGTDSDLKELRRNAATNADSFTGSLFRSLPAQAQIVLGALSLLGHPATPQVVKSVARTKRFSASVDLLVARGLAEIRASEISLRHDLIREAAYKRIPPLTRTDMHRSAALVLSKHKLAGEAAEHYYRAGMNAQAFAAGIRAAAEADAHHAYDDSIYFLRLALHVRPRSARRIRPQIAKRLHLMRRSAEALGELRLVLPLIRYSDADAVDLMLFEVELAYLLSEFTDGYVRQRLEIVKSQHPAISQKEKLRILRLQARSAHHEGVKEAIQSAIAGVRELAMKMEPPSSYEAIAFAARTHSLLTSSLEAEEWLKPWLEEMEKVEDVQTLINVLGPVSNVQYEAGDLMNAEKTQRLILQRMETAGVINEWPLVAQHLHMLLIEQGKYDEAKELNTEIRERAIAAEEPYTRMTLTVNNAAMLYELQSYDEAGAACAEALELMSKNPPAWIELELIGILGLVQLRQGQVSKAFENAERVERRLEQLGFLVCDTSYLHMLLCRVALLRGRPKAAVDRLKRAINEYSQREVICRLRMELELARTLKLSDRKEARSIANHVFEVAIQINARPLAEQADSLLLRL